MDDGSSDGTDAWLKGLGSQVKFRCLSHTGNLAEVRNKGLELATGDGILFLDDDDLLEPMGIDLLSDALLQNPETGFAFGQFSYFCDDRSGEPQLIRHWNQQKNVFYNLIAGKPLNLLTCLFRRSLLDQVGGLDPQLNAAEDYDFCLRVSKLVDGVLVSQPVARIRQQEVSMSSQRSIVATQNAIRAIERIRCGGSLPADCIRPMRRNLSKLYCSLARMNLDDGQYAAARRNCCDAITVNPISGRSWINGVRLLAESTRRR